MSAYNFGEKPKEYSAKHGGDIPVWKSPKYEAAKSKAIEVIESGLYGVTEADFWILMNATKSGKMAYSGLIISHNGCLKINDHLPAKFKPECVSIDKQGYRDSLVYTYCCPEQGIYEVGEVSGKNCSNDYPYAMAYKRMFDRVVLKLSKLAYNGIYSDSESDEFSQRYEAASDVHKEVQDLPNGTTGTRKGYDKYDPASNLVCQSCLEPIVGGYGKDGTFWDAESIVKMSRKRFGRDLCMLCMKDADSEKRAAQG